MVSLFCRHNRFTADCPICSRGTVLESPPGSGRGGRRAATARAPGTGAQVGSGGARGARAERRTASREASTYRGPYAASGPYERDGESYEVRLERVPGGLRLAEWSAQALRASAPVIAPRDVASLVAEAARAGALEAPEHAQLEQALADRPPEEPSGAAAVSAPDAAAWRHGASPGRSGELREELRVERLDQGRLRLARWVLRPGTGWDMLDAPTMLPARRYAEALADAVRQGLLSI